jgi:hypothetical protein
MLFFRFAGPLAQSVEHLPFKQGVAGSSPARLTFNQQVTCPFFIVCPCSKVRVRIGCRKNSGSGTVGAIDILRSFD